MPYYNYECECGETKREMKLMSQCDDDVFCDKCGKKMNRLFGVAFSIRGASEANGYSGKPVIDIDLDKD